MEINKLLEKINNDKLLKNFGIFFIGSFVLSFLNYIFNPVIARYLSIAEYGEVQTVFSITAFTGMISIIFRHQVVNMVKEKVEGLYERLNRVYTFALLFNLPLVLILAVFSPKICKFFKIDEPLVFLLFSISVLVSIPFIFYSSILNGKNQFVKLSISGIVAALVKLFASLLFISLGWGVYGVVGSLTVSIFIAILYILKYEDRLKVEWNMKKVWESFSLDKKYLSVVTVSTLFITFPYAGDVLLVKRLFSPEEAGLYAGMATIGKIVFFLTAPIAVVLLSATNSTAKMRNNHRLLVKSLLVILFVGGSATVFLTLFNTFSVKILMGEKYISHAGLLPIMSLTMLLVSLQNIFTNYFMSLRFTKSIYVYLLPLFVLSYFIYNAQGVSDIILAFMYSTIASLVISLYITLYKRLV